MVANSTIAIVKFKGGIGKYMCAASRFSTRLAVSKWIAPHSFLMGGVLGYPTSFLVDNWQAMRYGILPLPGLYIWQAKRKRWLNGISQYLRVL